MRKILILFYFFIINSSNVYANTINEQLNKLFDDLKISNESSSFLIEQKIWKLWSTHPDDEKLTTLLAEGSAAVNNNQLNEAINIFTKIIELDPNLG